MKSLKINKKYEEGLPKVGMPIDKWSDLRPGMMCRFDVDKWTKNSSGYVCPFDKEDVFVYLCDIAQAGGHCVVIKLNPKGKQHYKNKKRKPDQTFTWFHTCDFIPLTVEET